MIKTRVIAEVKTFAPLPAAARNGFLRACDVSRWPEQELCMKQPLHRKKLQLALQALGPEDDDLKGKLDHNWVTSECDVISLNTSGRALNRDWRLWRSFQGGWMTSASRSTRVTLMRLLWMDACCTTWPWWAELFKPRHAAPEPPSGLKNFSLKWQTSVAKGLLNNSFVFWLNKTFDSVSQEDLLSLKVGSVLHHLSIKRAIQVLRLNSYTPTCLRRRPSDEVSHLKPRPSLSLFFFFLVCFKAPPLNSFYSPVASRTTSHQQRSPSGPTTEWWSGSGLWIWQNTLQIWGAAASTEVWWWEGRGQEQV